MGKDNFTPGPWFAINVGDDDEPMYTVKAARIRGQKPGHEVAICATGDSPQEMETANAHLISAAPDLLAALRALLSHPRTDDRSIVFAPVEIATARAAIAKAEGK